MSFGKDLDYTARIREVKGVQFSILGGEEIKRRSVCHVQETILYDSRGEPVINGLMDPRMGVNDHGKICPTDGLDNKFCPGYFGHIELAKPVFHFQFMDIIMSILKSVCIKCSCLLIDPTEHPHINKIENKKRFSVITSLCSKVKVCKECGAIRPSKFEKQGLAKIYAVWKNLDLDKEGILAEDKKELLSQDKVLIIFKRITDEHSSFMGLNPKWCRPEWLICTNLPVPPPAVRPSIKQAGNDQRSEDDITHKLIDIIKTNNHLKKKLLTETSLENTLEEWTNVLQYHVATFVDNNLPGISPSSHRSGRPLKTIRERLKGKEGRIRGNLMGKRVDFSARTVITPDPNIKISELGVPIKMALNLTIPEKVNEYNIARMTMLVRNGAFQHPGAKSIKRAKDNRTTSLLHVDTSTLELAVGDIVHRHLNDGDTVLFNRQPSLHKMSMMAHKVIVMPYDTFRLNVSVTTPYNADFDGDEMNMHVPQSIQTSVELQELAAVPKQIISPREHKPIITPVQDTLLGVNRLTNDGVWLNENQMMNILMYVPSFDGILPKPDKKHMWSGRQLLSMVLPRGVNLKMKNGSYDDHPKPLNEVVIVEGQLLQGRIDKKIMSSGTKGLIHMIYNDLGYKMAQKFLDDLQNIVTRYLVITGFSVGISDLVANEKTNTDIEKTIVSKKKEVQKLVQQLHNNSFDKGISNTISEAFEKKVNNILNKAIAEAGKIGGKSLDPKNRMMNMISCGSKGKAINIAQMIACVGQQNVDGKRIPNGFSSRSLPHFNKYDISPEAKGFVQNSFIKGLNPTEFFFHAMGGREGLIDTAVKTSETGYIQRKLIKAMEDIKISYDLSVRNADGNIIEFLYGEDGFDYGKIESQPFSYFKMNYDSLEKRHRFAEKESWSLYLNNAVVKGIKKQNKLALKEWFDTIYQDYVYLRSVVFSEYADSKVNTPINISRIIERSKSMFKIVGTNLSNLSPFTVIEQVNKLIKSLRVNNQNGCNVLLAIILREQLSPKVILFEHRLNKLAFDYVIETILKQHAESLVQPNEMVGPIAAQSIGEPATQMTLNTFHFAGISEKSNVTRGVPRLKELLHLSKSLKAPSLTIYLDDKISSNKTQCQNILNQIELTLLNDILLSINVFYDPDDKNTLIDEDRELLQIYSMFSSMDEVLTEEDCGSKWIIRLEFDKEKILNKDITMEMIYHKMSIQFPDEVNCVYSDDNSGKLIFRMRLIKDKKGSFDKVNDLNYIKTFIKNLRDKVVVKGISNINSVSMFKNNKYVMNNKSWVQKEEWVLDTNGINLIEILQHNNVDSTRTISNDVYEVINILGIEAARDIILSEIREVINGAGSYVNYRHLNLLCDIMTHKGSLMSIDRFGINRAATGPLAKCSFEETTDQLFKAAIFGETDKLNGVSANIMMGQVAPAGTGNCEIMLDESKLVDMLYKGEEDIGDISTWGDKLDYCDENIGIDFDVSGLEAIDVPSVSVV